MDIRDMQTGKKFCEANIDEEGRIFLERKEGHKYERIPWEDVMCQIRLLIVQDRSHRK